MSLRMWRFSLGCLSMEMLLVVALQSLKISSRVADQPGNGFKSYSQMRPRILFAYTHVPISQCCYPLSYLGTRVQTGFIFDGCPLWRTLTTWGVIVGGPPRWYGYIDAYVGW
ncbi:hypothetical protein Ahy_B05g078833 isoform A [Arachis hypogaea]|uniref:Secreted protein n=1 Tax=Arachis hypogaea TaxID=3818 RepID=A0A444Z890_ARAHY|nr:hypothetical protein Ahy_B05g078833 isoform A [Arachis hypogaea]